MLILILNHPLFLPAGRQGEELRGGALTKVDNKPYFLDMRNAQNILTKSQNIYFVGIKGVGMTALAQILQSQGKAVQGSDTHEKFFTDKVLKKLRIPFKEGFRAQNLPARVDLVIYSTAFDSKNHPEILAAAKKKISCLSYPKALSALFNNSLGIAVSGTHGKTTTSALIAEALKNLGLNPTALIGSRVANWQANATTGKSPFFVIEADEHQNKLRFYRPWSIVLTNIDYDHPDYYRKPENYYRAFKKWVGKWQKSKSPVPQISVFNGDDPKTKRLLQELRSKNNSNHIIIKYGKSKNNHIRILNFESQISTQIPKKFQIPKNNYLFEINLPKDLVGNLPNKNQRIAIESSLIGSHNAYNLAAAVAFLAGLNIAARQVKANLKSISTREIAASLETFAGTERRMQFIGRKGRVLVYDDYAHHPAEINATLTAIKKHFPQFQVFVVFQSHTFTRTQAFLVEFVKSLSSADVIGLLPIYGSAREARGKITSADIAEKLTKKKKAAFNFSSHRDCLNFLNKYKFKRPAILITMGAGDGWQVGRKYLKMEKC